MRVEVDGDPADVVISRFDLAGVDAGPDLDAEAADAVSDGGRTLNGPGRSVEGGQKPVSQSLHFLAPEAIELPTNEGVMGIEELTPASVAEFRGPLGGTNDVGEHHGGQDALGRRRTADRAEELLDLVNDPIDVPHVDEVVGTGIST